MNTQELENIGIPLADAIFCPGCGHELDVFRIDPERPSCPSCGMNLADESERI
jgi:hypothetical protein